jgi:hypothetical protein
LKTPIMYNTIPTKTVANQVKMMMRKERMISYFCTVTRPLDLLLT